MWSTLHICWKRLQKKTFIASLFHCDLNGCAVYFRLNASCPGLPIVDLLSSKCPAYGIWALLVFQGLRVRAPFSDLRSFLSVHFAIVVGYCKSPWKSNVEPQPPLESLPECARLTFRQQFCVLLQLELAMLLACDSERATAVLWRFFSLLFVYEILILWLLLFLYRCSAHSASDGYNKLFELTAGCHFVSDCVRQTQNDRNTCIYLNKDWGCVILREIDFLLKICCAVHKGCHCLRKYVQSQFRRWIHINTSYCFLRKICNLS